MRKDLVDGFYGDKATGYKTPAACRKFAKQCEKSMLKWLNDTTKSNLADLKEFNSPQAQTGAQIIMAEDFQFDNSFDITEDTVSGLFDEISSDEEGD